MAVLKLIKIIYFFPKKMNLSVIIKFYVEFHRYDKLFENIQTFRAAYKSLAPFPLVMSPDVDIANENGDVETWISYLYSMCRDAYLARSLITIHKKSYPDFECYKLNARARRDDCDFISKYEDFLFDSGMILSHLDVNVRDNGDIDGRKLILNFRDIPDPSSVIDPIPIPSEIDSHSHLYKAYLKQKFTDVSLITIDQEFKLHRVVLYSEGGQYFERLYDSEFKQPADKIAVPGYTSATVSLYVDYLYLGSKAFENQPDVDIIELFVLANNYLQSNLERDCLNILNIQATPDDLPALIELNKQYEHPFLTKLIIRLESFIKLA